MDVFVVVQLFVPALKFSESRTPFEAEEVRFTVFPAHTVVLVALAVGLVGAWFTRMLVVGLTVHGPLTTV